MRAAGSMQAFALPSVFIMMLFVWPRQPARLLPAASPGHDHRPTRVRAGGVDYATSSDILLLSGRTASGPGAPAASHARFRLLPY